MPAAGALCGQHEVEQRRPPGPPLTLRQFLPHAMIISGSIGASRSIGVTGGKTLHGRGSLRTPRVAVERVLRDLRRSAAGASVHGQQRAAGPLDAAGVVGRVDGDRVEVGRVRHRGAVCVRLGDHRGGGGLLAAEHREGLAAVPVDVLHRVPLVHDRVLDGLPQIQGLARAAALQDAEAHGVDRRSGRRLLRVHDGDPTAVGRDGELRDGRRISIRAERGHLLRARLETLRDVQPVERGRVLRLVDEPEVTERVPAERDELAAGVDRLAVAGVAGGAEVELRAGVVDRGGDGRAVVVGDREAAVSAAGRADLLETAALAVRVVDGVVVLAKEVVGRVAGSAESDVVAPHHVVDSARRRAELRAALIDDRYVADGGQVAVRGEQLIGKTVTRAMTVRGADVRRLDGHLRRTVRPDAHRVGETGERDLRRGGDRDPAQPAGRPRQQLVGQFLGDDDIGLAAHVHRDRDHALARRGAVEVVEVVGVVLGAESLLGQRDAELVGQLIDLVVALALVELDDEQVATARGRRRYRRHRLVRAVVADIREYGAADPHLVAVAGHLRRAGFVTAEHDDLLRVPLRVSGEVLTGDGEVARITGRGLQEALDYRLRVLVALGTLGPDPHVRSAGRVGLLADRVHAGVRGQVDAARGEETEQGEQTERGRAGRGLAVRHAWSPVPFPSPPLLTSPRRSPSPNPVMDGGLDTVARSTTAAVSWLGLVAAFGEPGGPAGARTAPGLEEAVL